MGELSTQGMVTELGVPLGTFAYMSPEQARGKELDARTDLFSFGATLYEMATGVLPFRGKTLAEVHDSILNRAPARATLLNSEVSPRLQEIIEKCLEKDRNLRYQSASDLRADLQRLKRDSESGRSGVVNDGRPAWRPWRWMVVAAVVVVAVTLAARYFLGHASAAKLTDKDTVVLAEFTNTSGDPVFDGTLREGLSSQLEQSPFLSLLSDSRIAQTLTLMTRPRDTRLTPELAREVCQRTASAATIEGSIASLGSQYVLGLKAVNCGSGDLMAQEQVTVNGKEQVLKALGEAATKMRAKLGESLASVQKYDVRPEDVTTPSLEALQAYSLGISLNRKTDATDAVPALQRAISLDPNFAAAYASLGANYSNLGQSERASESLRKAYELRNRVSEFEKFSIVSRYQILVTGNLEEANKTLELYARTYPREATPLLNLSVSFSWLGDYEKVLAALQRAQQLSPGLGLTYLNLAVTYIRLGRFEEAKVTFQQAQANHLLDSRWVPQYFYLVAVVQHDAADMEREAAAAPGDDYVILYLEGDTAAYAGELAKAEALTRRAISLAERTDNKEAVAAYHAAAAVRDALLGNLVLARRKATVALALSQSKDVQAMAAMALALSGDDSQATRLARDLGKRFPEDTIAQFNYLPSIRALIELHKADAVKNPQRAIDALAATAPYELGSPMRNFRLGLYPVYVRGEAYLAAGQGPAAVAEFEKILHHPGIVGNQVIGALAHLQIGRCCVLSGDTAKAKAAYQDFFTLWKNADPDIPILKAAKAEYAKLR
jgi:tetratricopeptide (TPR) repeat protein